MPLSRIRLRRRRLARALTRKSLTQNGWARRIGISSSHLSMLLSGERRYPNQNTRSKLLAVLDLDSEALFVREEPMKGWPMKGLRMAPSKVITRTLRHFLNVVNLKPSLQSLWRKPGLSLLLIGILALGMGASIAIFSIVDAVLLSPLPFAHSERLVAVWQTYPHWRADPILSEFWDHIPLSFPEYRDWRRQQTVFDDVAIVATRPATLLSGERPRQVKLGLASRSFFPLLQITPVLGGGLETAAPVASGAPILLSYGLWEQYFSSDTDILGSSIRLDKRLFTVVGVLPRGFRFRQRFLRGISNQADLWTLAEGFDRWVADRGNRSFSALGRLREGVQPESAHSETETLLRGEIAPERRSARIVQLHTEWTREARSALLPLLAGVGLLLLVACGNAAGLLMGETARRSDELAIRTALGASRSGLVLQVLKESFVLALAAAAIGAWLAGGILGLMLVLLPSELPRATEIGLDLRVLAFSLLLGNGYYPPFRNRTGLVSDTIFGHCSRFKTGHAET